MQAGTLNRRLQFQTVVMTADSEGAVLERWTNVATVWAHIAPLSAQELFIAAQTAEKVTHRITIRYRKDVTPKMRLVYGTRIFLVHSVLDPDEDHIQLDCLCEEYVTSGVGQT